MTWLGRFQLGDWVPVRLLCHTQAGLPVSPTSAPTMTIYDASGTKTLSRDIPPMDLAAKTGLFQFEQPLDSNFSAGQYFVLLEWTDGTINGKELRTFQVLAGGDDKGAYDSLYFYERPHADFIVGKTDIGTLETRRNPKV